MSQIKNEEQIRNELEAKSRQTDELKENINKRRIWGIKHDLKLNYDYRLAQAEEEARKKIVEQAEAGDDVQKMNELQRKMLEDFRRRNQERMDYVKILERRYH